MSLPTTNARPLRILVAALGGQGGGVLAEWLVEAATQAGFVAQSTSIPGVAQRTGATTYYIELYPVPLAQLAGRRPVLGLYPVPGAIDLVVASDVDNPLIGRPVRRPSSRRRRAPHRRTSRASAPR